MTLRVGPTSLDRVDGDRLQHRVSSLPLLSVQKVYLFTDDATQVPQILVFMLNCSFFFLLKMSSLALILILCLGVIFELFLIYLFLILFSCDLVSWDQVVPVAKLSL